MASQDPHKSNPSRARLGLGTKQPVPDKEMRCGLPSALLRISIAATCDPGRPGTNVTSIVQLAAGRTVVHACETRKLPVDLMASITKGARPTLRTSIRALLADPMYALP